MAKPEKTPAQTNTATDTDKNESKADKFKRLASLRVSKAIQSIKVVGNLGSAAYERTPQQVEAITSRLHAEVDALAKVLAPDAKREAAKTTFSL